MTKERVTQHMSSVFSQSASQNSLICSCRWNIECLL